MNTKKMESKKDLLELVNRFRHFLADDVAAVDILKKFVADGLELTRGELDEFYDVDSEDIAVMDLRWLLMGEDDTDEVFRRAKERGSLPDPDSDDEQERQDAEMRLAWQEAEAQQDDVVPA